MESLFEPLTMNQILSHGAERQIRVYVDGVFDLFHYGHMEFLRQTKAFFPDILVIAGVVTDEDVYFYKGKKSIMTHEERIKSVRMCSLVDEIIERPPFYPTIQFLNNNRIDLVAHDSLPYPITVEHIEDCYKPFKDVDRFLPTVRTPLISTSNLIQRIINRIEEYKDTNKSNPSLN